jgi:dienelactone hydrolase
MRRYSIVILMLLACWCQQPPVHAGADGPAGAAAIAGTVDFIPAPTEKQTPECYRMEAFTFKYEMQKRRTPDNVDVEVYDLRFPSPVVTEYPENNTVHAEYYRPKGQGPFPGVILLGILGGDQKLERLQAAMLAQKKVATLFVQMAYYGPRRPVGKKVRLLTPDVTHTMAAVRQSVLDIRCAAAWLAVQPEVDKERLGLMGTSLGSLIGSVTAAQEPRFKRVAIILGGGGLVDAFYDHPRAQGAREIYEIFGGSRKALAERIAMADPLTFAPQLKTRQILMIAAKRDDVIPPSATERLWKALDQPRIIWYDATHIGAIAYALPALNHVVTFFHAP